MKKLEAIKYFLVDDDSAEAFSCIREIVEDFNEPIPKIKIDELIDQCNS